MMTPRELIDSTGLSQSETARVIGVHVRAVQRWIAGDRELPPPARKLLTVLRDHPEMIEAIRQA